jgi:hypothetical protein
MWFGVSLLMFWKNILHQSSGQKSMLRMNKAYSTETMVKIYQNAECPRRQ